MPEHYPRTTTSVSAWCNTCGRRTMHRVDDRRLGSCLEHGREGMSKAQQKRREALEQAAQQPCLNLEGLSR